jgi:LytS/YehU family sensor histidine kinase
MTTKPDELVPLKKEIEHINQFINLHKQLSSGICIQFDLKGDLNGKSILPCILITFVENAFKYGVTHSAETPILIHLQSDENDIKFKVTNKKSHQRNLPSTGIGHYNLKQQLELFYNKRHELIINQDQENYCCELILTV